MDTYQQNQVDMEQIRYAKRGRNIGLVTASTIALYLTLQGLIFVGEYAIIACFVAYFVSPLFFVLVGTILGRLIGKFRTTQSSGARISLLVIITLIFFIAAYFVVPTFLELLG
jgi:uncharacterized membrane protein YkvA (DUF1232 family)